MAIKCDTCGAENEDADADSCEYCGARLSAEQRMEEIRIGEMRLRLAQKQASETGCDVVALPDGRMRQAKRSTGSEEILFEAMHGEAKYGLDTYSVTTENLISYTKYPDYPTLREVTPLLTVTGVSYELKRNFAGSGLFGTPSVSVDTYSAHFATTTERTAAWFLNSEVELRKLRDAVNLAVGRKGFTIGIEELWIDDRKGDFKRHKKATSESTRSRLRFLATIVFVVAVVYVLWSKLFLSWTPWSESSWGFREPEAESVAREYIREGFQAEYGGESVDNLKVRALSEDMTNKRFVTVHGLRK